MLELKNVNTGYDGKDVIQDISFTLNDGQNLCIIGPNGCGKTTLIKAIAGLLPIEGQIIIDNKDMRKMKRREIAGKIAVMSQLSNIFFSYTVYETVLLGRYLHMKGAFKGPSSYDKNCVDKCLKAVGLLKHKDRQINTLSGGQLQRVYLARTLAQEPSIILLDEPTNHLDLRYQAELIDYLKEWSSKDGNSIVGVLHDINLALKLADNFLVLDKGYIKSYGSASKAVTNDLINSVYGMDVVGFMIDSLRKWERIANF
ncbi:ABC transporter ATP-binding protein [Tissierella creatinini]|nr:ABC transporter ATP-binding protein [Tissierella creatinini]TJX63901.1 ABC transporter ATP-binding protein [Soehngenia saccharolytica]